jgi:hypothetical protein
LSVNDTSRFLADQLEGSLTTKQDYS